MDEKQRRQFRWGLLLAWCFPVFFVVVIVLTSIRHLSASHTTGLTAIAGEAPLGFADFGIFVAIVFEIIAIILLVRAWPGSQSPVRTLMSLASIGCAVLVLFISGFAVWSAVHRVLH